MIFTLGLSYYKHINTKDVHSRLEATDQRPQEDEGRAGRKHQRLARRGEPPPVDRLHRGPRRHRLVGRPFRDGSGILAGVSHQAAPNPVPDQDVPPQHLQRRQNLPRQYLSLTQSCRTSGVLSTTSGPFSPPSARCSQTPIPTPPPIARPRRFTTRTRTNTSAE